MSVVATVSEIPSLGKKLVIVDGQEILLINFKGAIHAVENECPHQGAPLAGAIVKDGYLACPRHGYRFQLSDGSCKEFPEYRLKTWPVQIDGDQVIVDIKA
jgi:3-phenylpropionate/trans-cinnamate dioxygenase ferredoxin component